MRVSEEEKQKTHLRIVEGATRLVRERGIENTSVSDVMSEAGMTNGGFYRHFETREALLVVAIEAAFSQFCSALEHRFVDDEPAVAAAGYRSDYLSAKHVANPGNGCPLAALAGDVRHGSTVLKAAFGAGAKRAISGLAQGMRGSKRQRRELATREMAMLVGAVMIARASDPDTAQAVLDACRPSSVTAG